MATPSHERLLDSLAENSLVKAAVVIDVHGAVQSRRGHAQVLRAPPTTKIQVNMDLDDDEVRENVYMVELRSEILAVIFEEPVEFERLRHAVDVLIRHHELDRAPPPTPGLKR